MGHIAVRISILVIVVTVLGATFAVAGETHSLSASLPNPVDFHVAMVKPPDSEGVFHGSVFLRSRLAKLPVKLSLHPTEGIEVLVAPKRLGWRLAKGEKVVVDFTARISRQAPRPAGLNIKLRLRYPAKVAQTIVESDSEPRSRLKDLVAQWASLPKGGPVVKVDRSFFFGGER